jgi:ribose transport system substrate-binding protein/inositol transport system substrate-binding protein
MKRLLTATAICGLLGTAAQAENIGVSMALFDDNFLTVLRNGMGDHAASLDGVTLQIEDAQNDVGKQLNQIQNFVASGVDAIIVNPVDTDATVAMSQAAADAGIPLVYVNREPVNVDDLPENQAFVASDEKESGTLETQEICRLLKEAGKTEAKAVVLMGELSNQAARMRTQDIKDVIATPECSFIQIVEEQTANWSRTQAADLMTNWITSGLEFDAVISNNDEMAIGAIQAMKSADVSMDDVIVGGVDATQDALAAM